MSTTKFYSRRLRLSVAVRVLVLALAASSLFDSAAAQDRVKTAAVRAAAMTLPGLERAFWWCDHAATTRGVDSEDNVACTAVYDELKQRRFGGDFDQLLAWWRANKPAEHRKLELAQREDGESTADEDGLAAP